MALHPPIETLGDWNARLCGCCEMPACPVPLTECEGIQATVTECSVAAEVPTGSGGGWTDPGCELSIYGGFRTVTVDTTVNRSDIGGYTTQTVRTYHYLSASSDTCTSTFVTTDGIGGGEVIPGTLGLTLNPVVYTQGAVGSDYFYQSVTTGVGSGGSGLPPSVTYSATTRITYSNRIPDKWAFLHAKLDAMIAAGTPAPGSCEARTQVLIWTDCAGIDPDEPTRMRKNTVRYRWAVPDTWLGSYFKITWDVLDEPDGWDADPPLPVPPVRTLIETDNTWEWTGPGDPMDADSWVSGWYDIDPPLVAGRRRIVNVRFSCYQGTKFGVKPQVTGEAFEPPPP